MVPTPQVNGQNLTIQAYSADLIYSIWSGRLFKYNDVTVRNDEIYSLPTCGQYQIRNRGNKIVVMCMDSVLFNSFLNANVSFYILQ